MKFQKLKKWP